MIELLAPAKNYEYGVAAILAGADAVYIGAPKFGARQGAVNSLEDINNLTQFAHQYGVKVFVTLNTVLFDHELEQAKEIAQALDRIGVDALIVQDMSYLMFGLNVPLHASTQAAALTPEKALFYERAGFERVILERAMSLED
ncbi:MAG: peptidase U32 family protein, partial [Rikenellaceae bacterium]